MEWPNKVYTPCLLPNLWNLKKGALLQRSLLQKCLFLGSMFYNLYAPNLSRGLPGDSKDASEGHRWAPGQAQTGSKPSQKGGEPKRVPFQHLEGNSHKLARVMFRTKELQARVSLRDPPNLCVSNGVPSKQDKTMSM